MNKVSVLMPAYNAAEFTREAIESIIHQTHSDWELLILDDGSSDDTAKIIASLNDGRIKFFQNEENQGYLKSCNSLFELAEGDFITFLDADDTCPPERLEKCLSKLKESESDFLTTDHTRFWEDGTEELFEQPVDFNRLASDSEYYPTICGATIFVKKELLETVGHYHPAFDGMGAEDYHWLFRLSREGNGIHLTESLFHYRQHSGQIRQSSKPENFVAHDLDKVIRRSLINEGVDLLQPEHSNQLDQVKRQLLKPFKDDHTLIYRYRSIQLLNEQHPAQAISTMSQALGIAPFSSANWSRLLYILYIALRRFAGI